MANSKKAIKSSAIANNKSSIPRDYADWLAGLKSRISSARQRATLTVNQELVRLYHQIDTEILDRQTRQGWGAKVIDRLAADLRAAFPDMKGFSSRNLKYMKFFAEKCPAGLIGQQPAAQLPWFHLVTLLTKVSADSEREWYAAHVIQHGWSRPTLDVHIKNQLHLRQGGAITNFDRHLPSPHAIIDVVEILVGGDRPRKYRNDLKKKLIAEGYSEVSEKIGQLKMAAPNGKQRFTDCRWLSRVGKERIDEKSNKNLNCTVDPRGPGVTPLCGVCKG